MASDDDDQQQTLQSARSGNESTKPRSATKKKKSAPTATTGSRQQRRPLLAEHNRRTRRNSEEQNDADSSSLENSPPLRRSKMDIDDTKSGSPGHDGLGMIDRRSYDRLYYVTQLVGLVLFVLVLILAGEHLGGIGFGSPSMIFNFHPIFMVAGFLVIYSNAMLVYRSFRTELKQKLKLMHTILNGSAMCITFFGSMAAIYFHHKANITHFYSLHSWLGISTWLLFLSQFGAGFIAFLFPGVSNSLRSKLMPFHRFIGVATFVLASATCLTGLNEKAIFALKNPSYSSLPAGGILTNIIALVLCAYSALTVYLTTKPEYQRRPLPEEQVGPNRSKGNALHPKHLTRSGDKIQ